MRRSLITLLVVITLLAQWSWLEHDYHDHKAGEVCEVCVSASGHVAVPPSTLQLPNIHGSDFVAPPLVSSLSITSERFYPTRAPPRFL